MNQTTQRRRAAWRRAPSRPVLLVAVLGILIAPQKAGAITHCVSTAEELQTALTAAADNSTNDYILIQRGTYTGNFEFGSYQHWPLTIQGGYDSECATRVDDPSTTVLDAQGSGTVLSLYQHAGGGVHVEGVTLQNGGYHGLWVRLVNEYEDSSIEHIHLINTVVKDCRLKSGVYMTSEPGAAVADPILIYDNVITGNVGERSGISITAAWTLLGSYVVLRNNLIAGNVSTDTTGGVYISNYSLGDVYLTNNTIVENKSTAPVSTTGGISVGVGTSFHAYNNIVRRNVSSDGAQDISLIYFEGTGTGNGYNNVYGDMSGSWTFEDLNHDVDPGFVDPGYWDDNGTPADATDDYWVAGDYHLRPDSACIDAGSDDASGPGALPPEDLDGEPRVMDGDGDGAAVVDIGADESAVILSDGFESGDTTAWSAIVGGGP